MNRFICVIAIVLLAISNAATAQVDTTQQPVQSNTAILLPSPTAVTNVTVVDTPDDNGNSLNLTWDLSADDAAMVDKYQILRATSANGPFEVIGSTTKGQHEFTNNDLDGSVNYYFKIVALNEPAKTEIGAQPGSNESTVVGPVKPVAQWFNTRRIWILIWTLVVCGAILFYIAQAKAGKDLYVRKIAGIDAVDEAIGRATEMGRKVFYVPGIQDMDDVQTIAAVTILGRVARIAAENDTMLDVPVCKSLVMVTAREAVREAYSKVGRPDAFHEDMVHYVTDDQFGYAAAIDGMVVRDKPATMFYMGAFFAESLILAETGNAAGAIQIAGTGQPSQLPFFVASCDYTLIGEELFAASAYLAREPKLLGSLKGQDFAKGLFLIAIIIGIILELMDVGFIKILQVS
ncbi:MAG: fibronectin type III domain-containing protein [Candidatus Zixiibacteriota bacterium]